MIEILAIDDDRGILEVIRKALSRDGYGVTVLDDPGKLDERRLEKYQLILLDVMMPGTDGFALCRKTEPSAGTAESGDGKNRAERSGIHGQRVGYQGNG